jgi:hypothetical protein
MDHPSFLALGQRVADKKKKRSSAASGSAEASKTALKAESGPGKTGAKSSPNTVRWSDGAR